MARSVYLVHHVTPAELERLYKHALDGIERSHFHILWLLSRGHTVKFTAAVTGYSVRWISTLIGRYNAEGLVGLGDRRRSNPGGKPLLDVGQQARLRASLADPPPDGGLWSGRTVAQWIAGMLGRLISPRRATDYLRRLGFTRQVPRPRHAEADLGAQESFKASFRRHVQARQQEKPTTPVEVWAVDEHRIGLKPVLRRVWAPRGCRPWLLAIIATNGGRFRASSDPAPDG